MKQYLINVFKRVIIKRMKEENKTVDEILKTFTKLSEKEKETLKIEILKDLEN